VCSIPWRIIFWFSPRSLCMEIHIGICLSFFHFHIGTFIDCFTILTWFLVSLRYQNIWYLWVFFQTLTHLGLCPYSKWLLYLPWLSVKVHLFMYFCDLLIWFAFYQINLNTIGFLSIAFYLCHNDSGILYLEEVNRVCQHIFPYFQTFGCYYFALQYYV